MEPILHMFMYMMRMEILHWKELMLLLMHHRTAVIRDCYVRMVSGNIIRMVCLHRII